MQEKIKAVMEQSTRTQDEVSALEMSMKAYHLAEEVIAELQELAG